MDVRMPDGTIITNVPDGTTKEQLLAKLNAFNQKQTAAKPAEESSILERAGDVGLSLAQGAVGLGEAALGLANIPTLGLAGKGAEVAEKALFGGTTKDLQAYLQSKKTPEAQAAERKVQEAEGFTGTIGALLENPSALLGTIAESAPSMVGGAGVARLGMSAAKKLGTKVGTATAAALGEGAVSAGSTAESIRQQTESGDLSAGQAGIAAVSGALTGILGKFGSKVADKLGIDDIDVLLAGGRKTAQNAATKSVLASAIKGAISESVFEELPQSMQEQISQNVALGKPWDENVAEAGAIGAMAALGMGGAGSAASQVLTNANIKAQQKRDALAAQEPDKPGKSMMDLQDEEDSGEAEPSQEDVSVKEQEIQQKQEAAPTELEQPVQEQPVQEQPAVQEAQPLTPQEQEDKDFEDYLFPAGRALRSPMRPEAEVRQQYEEATAEIDAALAANDTAAYEKAQEKYRSALEALKEVEAGYQAPLFAEQKGLDLGEPTSERAVQVTAPSSMPTIGQMGLDFAAQISPEGNVEPAPIKVKEEPRKFGMTTPVTAKPLEDFLSLFKPRSSSPAEQSKQQNGIVNLNDRIREVYEDVPTEERAYYLDLINTFFDKYASAPLPSREADFSNLNNLNAEDQKRVAEKHFGSSFPDLTTYEGVKKLQDEFDEHIAEAQLAGLGITRSSSAYKQLDPIVRELRKKPKTQYDPAEQAAFDYLSMFDLDTALRSAAFDIATNTPRNQLFRGQGKDSAERFNEWLLYNAPQKVNYLFDQYVRGYRKANEGFKAFETLQDNSEAEQAYRDSYLEGEEKPYFGQRTTGAPALHPAVRAYVNNNDINGLLKLMAKQSRTPYGKQLAAKLLSLNLTTSIGFNKVSDAVRNWEPTFNRILTKFVAEQSELSPKYAEDLQSLLDYANNTEASEAKYQTILKDLLRIKHLSNNGEAKMDSTLGYYNQLAKMANDAYESYRSPGVYFGKEDAISINTAPDQNGENIYNIMHEIMHAATANVVDGVMRNPSAYTEKQRKAVEEINQLYFTVLKRSPKDKNFYGTRNMHEFIAEAFTNPEFQKYLQSIKYKQSPRSVWDKFVEFCLKLFGMDNVLSATIAATNDLFNAPRDSVSTSSISTPFFNKKMIKMFESNSAERSGPFEFFTDLYKNTKDFNSLKDNLAQELETMNSQTRKTWLGALTLRQLEEVIGKIYTKDPETGKLVIMSKVPQIAKYIELVEGMRKRTFDIIKKATDTSKQLLQIQREAPDTVAKLGMIIQTATVEDVDVTKDTAPLPLDPNKVTPAEQRRMQAYKELREEYLDLGRMKYGEAAQQIYKDMFAFFRERLDEYKTTALRREIARLQQEFVAKVRKDFGALEANRIDFESEEFIDEATAIENKAKETVEKKFPTPIENYFPLKRFGEFWARVGSGKNRRYYQFESARARDRFVRAEQAKLARELKKLGTSDIDIGKTINDPAFINYKNSLPELMSDMFSDRAVYEQVRELVAAAGVADGVEQITDPQELRTLILDKLGELWITNLPAQSIQKMFMHRQNVPGASADIIRSFQHAAFHLAYQQGRYEFGPEMENRLLEAKGYIRAMSDTEQGAILSDYLTEVEKRHKEQVIKPPPSAPWANFLSNMNFLWYLTAPASFIVNMFAVPSIALPVVGAKYGMAKASKQFMKNMKLLSSSGVRDIRVDKDGNSIGTGEFDAPSIRRAKGLTNAQREALELVSDSLLEQSLAHDAAGMSENPSLEYSGMWGKIMNIATFGFHKAERFNREVTFLTAFDLAYERNGGNLKAAVKEASDITWKTMFDYATYNKPRFVKGDLARVLFAFKQYAQHMTYLLFRTGYEATRPISDAEYKSVLDQYGKEAAEKYVKEMGDIRSEARRSFLMLMGMSFLFAGAAGLPVWWLLKGIGKAFHAVFGEEQEGWDFDNEFKNKMNEVFGGFVGDSISRGIIPQVTGASLSQRMSTNLGDMWFRDTRKNLDEVDWFKETMVNLLGPTVGIGVNAMEAVKRYKDGHPERALEAIAPAAFKNILAGSRLASEGALTMKGDTLMESVTGTEAFLQMLGFTPERLAQKQAASIEAKSAEQSILDKKQDLLNFLALAIDADDDEAQERVLEKIDAFNDRNPEFAISGGSIRSSMSRRAKARAMSDALGGVRVNPKFADRAEEMMEYAEEEE